MLNQIDFSNLAKDSETETLSIPERIGNIKKVLIKEKIKALGFSLENDISLGDFDQLGEMTARKMRSPGSDLYKTAGAYFRPNYERGILIYCLIKKYNVKSFLEIGFGRGYGTFCAAMAMHENGGGKIVTVDPNFNQDHLDMLGRALPKEWLDMVSFIGGKSEEYLPTTSEKFDFIYIDGDHTYEATKKDWEMCKKRYNKILLFDDYHLPGKVQKDIDCSNLIDQIEDESKELIIMDRRIFFDDRGYADEEIDYGQVLLTKA